MAKKNFNAWELQQKVNEVDNKAEQTYVDEKVNDINSSLEDITNTYAKKIEVNELASNKAEKTELCYKCQCI